LRGEPRVNVRPFPDTATGAARAVTEEGIGLNPAWSRDSGTIYLVTRNPGGSPTYSLMAVPVTSTPTTLTLAARRERLDIPLEYFAAYARVGQLQAYNVLPDGGFIVTRMVQPPASAGAAAEPAANTERPRINVVLNWFEELKQLVPAE
jgi:hypothetical protein